MIYRRKGNVEFFGFANQVFTNSLNILETAEDCGTRVSSFWVFLLIIEQR